MVVRQRRKKNKLRGQRTHGGGGTKNRRGAGSRGGVGRAGAHKHKFSKYYVDYGTKRKLKAKEKGIAYNVGFIDQMVDDWVAQGKAKKDGSIIVVDAKALGFEKVLGTGTLTKKIRVDGATFSKKAAEKIKKAGGIVDANEEAMDEEFEAEETEGGEEEQ